MPLPLLNLFHLLLWACSPITFSFIPTHFFWSKSVLVLISDKLPLIWHFAGMTSLPCYLKTLGKAGSHKYRNSGHCPLKRVSEANGWGWLVGGDYARSCLETNYLSLTDSTDCPLTTDTQTSKLCTSKEPQSSFLHFLFLFPSQRNLLTSLQSCSHF